MRSATILTRPRRTPSTGRSSRTFVTEGLWEKVRAELKPGDYVSIQHTSRGGAELNADCVVEGLKALGKNPLGVYLK